MGNLNSKKIKQFVFECEKTSSKQINLGFEYFSNFSFESELEINLVLLKSSQLDFILECENFSSIQKITINAQIYSGALLQAFIFSNSSNITIDLNCNLLEQNSECDIKILSFIGIESSNTINTYQNHLAHSTKSSIKTKRVLNLSSFGKYTGKILITEFARNSDACQHDDVFMLADNIKNISIPALEIKNNDVKCKHSFAAHKIDEQQIFYFKSRGLDIIAAKKMSLNAFIDDIFNNCFIKTKIIKNKASILVDSFF